MAAPTAKFILFANRCRFETKAGSRSSTAAWRELKTELHPVATSNLNRYLNSRRVFHNLYEITLNFYVPVSPGIPSGSFEWTRGEFYVIPNGVWVDFGMGRKRKWTGARDLSAAFASALSNRACGVSSLPATGTERGNIFLILQERAARNIN